MALNNTLTQDTSALTAENPQVSSIMAKLDLIGSFVRMLFRVLTKITGSKTWTKATQEVKSQPIYSTAYHNLIQNPLNAAILVQIFGISIGLQ